MYVQAYSLHSAGNQLYLNTPRKYDFPLVLGIVEGIVRHMVIMDIATSAAYEVHGNSKVPVKLT